MPERPQTAGRHRTGFLEHPTAHIGWLAITRYSDIPAIGRTLFAGSLAERNALYREFRSYVRQARAYWDAASAVDGSAAALPYYYAALNLAKAELLTYAPEKITGQKIKHGLLYKASSSTSIRGDSLHFQDGVFRLLFEKRTGIPPTQNEMAVVNVFSLIPEIALEFSDLGPTRPRAVGGYHTVAVSDSEAWPLVALNWSNSDQREPLERLLTRHFEEVNKASLPNWRDLLALSTRRYGDGIRLFQSKQVFSLADGQGGNAPDFASAAQFMSKVFGLHLNDDYESHSDFLLGYSVYKSKKLVVPIHLVRYAAMFYLSSLVRYKPTAIDPYVEPAQAWIMDSFVKEVPVNLLLGFLAGITNSQLTFEVTGYRV